MCVHDSKLNFSLCAAECNSGGLIKKPKNDNESKKARQPTTRKQLQSSFPSSSTTTWLCSVLRSVLKISWFCGSLLWWDDGTECVTVSIVWLHLYISLVMLWILDAFSLHWELEYLPKWQIFLFSQERHALTHTML